MVNDTIVAPVTAPGESAVAITRLSGPEALTIAARHFRGRRSPERSPSHRILFGAFIDVDGARLDSVLLLVFRAPRSYTGEDVVEISSHGGIAVPRSIVDALIRSGARPARPGEFTERAYRNGKLDLAQAESVAAVVRARSERAARAADATLGGTLSRRVAALDDALVALLAQVEARIDFPVEVGEAIDGAALAARCDALAGSVREWLSRLPASRRHEQGVRVAIVGRPNVGKSSLLNALVGYERAIVNETPGTTRDLVEASLWLDGVELRLADTAGWRTATDPVEQEGVARARGAVDRSDLALLVLDRSTPIHEEDEAIGCLLVPTRSIVAWNKTDLAGPGARPLAPLSSRAIAEVETTAIAPAGVELLVGALQEALPCILGAHGGEEIAAVSARQEGCLGEALEALTRAGEGLREERPYDLIAADLTEARRALGEIVGRGVDQAVIAAIFSNFCIGK